MTTTESRPRTAREWQAQTCTACRHSQGSHFESFDRTLTGCATMVPMPSAPRGEETCICIGFNREDQ